MMATSTFSMSRSTSWFDERGCECGHPRSAERPLARARGAVVRSVVVVWFQNKAREKRGETQIYTPRSVLSPLYRFLSTIIF